MKQCFKICFLALCLPGVKKNNRQFYNLQTTSRESRSGFCDRTFQVDKDPFLVTIKSQVVPVFQINALLWESLYTTCSFTHKCFQQLVFQLFNDCFTGQVQHFDRWNEWVSDKSTAKRWTSFMFCLELLNLRKSPRRNRVFSCIFV